MKTHIPLLTALFFSFNTFAGLSPNDPRWQIVEAFKSRKQTDYARLQIQVEEAKQAKVTEQKKKIDQASPELSDNGMPIAAFQIKSRLKDPESLVIRKWDCRFKDFLNGWYLVVDYNAKNSLGGYTKISRAAGYVKDGKWDFQILF